MDGADARWQLEPSSAQWPTLLACIEEPFGCIRGRGDAEALEGPCISIIGARRATPYGIAAAELAGRVAAECGLVVVSGGAMGCDHAAGMAAIAAGGRTVVVAGTAADVIYPRSSADLFDAAVRTGGCVISLESWGQGPRRYAFPKRNRLIAALSASVVVTEAGDASGTFGTAIEADQMGHRLYAIPGPIFSPTSRGTNKLIADGAAIIPDEEALEMQISIDYGVCRLMGAHVGGDRGQILSALVACPCRVEELGERVGKDVLTVLRTLTDYEAAGLVERLPDGRYSPTSRALLGDNVIDGT